MLRGPSRGASTCFPQQLSDLLERQLFGLRVSYDADRLAEPSGLSEQWNEAGVTLVAGHRHRPWSGDIHDGEYRRMSTLVFAYDHNDPVKALADVLRIVRDAGGLFGFPFTHAPPPETMCTGIELMAAGNCSLYRMAWAFVTAGLLRAAESPVCACDSVEAVVATAVQILEGAAVSEALPLDKFPRLLEEIAQREDSRAGVMAAHLIRGLEAENPPKLLAALREILNGNL